MLNLTDQICWLVPLSCLSQLIYTYRDISCSCFLTNWTLRSGLYQAPWHNSGGGQCKLSKTYARTERAEVRQKFLLHRIVDGWNWLSERWSSHGINTDKCQNTPTAEWLLVKAQKLSRYKVPGYRTRGPWALTLCLRTNLAMGQGSKSCTYTLFLAQGG